MRQESKGEVWDMDCQQSIQSKADCQQSIQSKADCQQSIQSKADCQQRVFRVRLTVSKEYSE